MAKSEKTSSSSPKPAAQGRIFLGLITIKRDRHGQLRFSPNWKRVFVFGAFGAVGAYLAACAALFLFLRYYKGYETFTYADSLTAFFEFESHREKLGNYHVEKGLEMVRSQKRQDVIEGFRLLRLGVQRAPTNVEGRLVLAEYYEILLRRSDMAADLLIKGIEYAEENPAFLEAKYLTTLYTVLLRNYLDFRAIEVSQTLLRSLDEKSREYLFVATQLALALFYRGDFDDAEETLYDYNLLRTEEGLSLLALIRHNQNRTEEAVSLLETFLDVNPQSRIGFERLMSIYRDAKQFDKLRQMALLWSIRYPDYTNARINLMYAYDEEGNENGLRDEMVEITKHDLDNPEVLQVFSFAAETGRPSIIEYVIQELGIDEDDRLSSQAKISLAEAHVRAGNPELTLQFISELERDNPNLFASVQSLLNGIRSVALYFENRPIDGQVYLREFLSDSAIRPAVYLAMAELFESAGLYKVTQDILKESYQRHPQDHRTLSALVEIDAVVGDMDAFRTHLRALVKSRVPTREAVLSAYRELSSDRHLFVEDREDLFQRMSTYFENQS